MTKEFPARLHILLARHSPLAVVIRRGPSKQVCTLLWNRENDTFELGQWPDSLFLMFLGKKDKVAKCKIFFYSGVYLKMKGDNEKARLGFERTKEAHASDCFELHAADFELAYLISNKTTVDSLKSGAL